VNEEKAKQIFILEAIQHRRHCQSQTS